ncbi:hypothetical protein KUA24_150 [Vibrio phage HNL01]|nr:hypothetical protein KUA24_150 [Vibrio phage HNL01]
MSDTQPKVAIRTTSKAMSTEYNVWFDSDIEGSAEFHEQLYIMRSAGEGDLVKVHISSFGGCVSTVSTIQDVIKKSEAHFHGILEGYGYSAGGAIFLLCDTHEVADLADMMVHTIQTGASGSSQSIESRGVKVGKSARIFVESIYKDFLTQNEMEEVLIGKEFWFIADEVRERLEKRQAIREADALAEMKEQLPFETYAQNVLADITEDCELFDYDVVEMAKAILEFAEGTVEPLEGVEMPTEVIGNVDSIIHISRELVSVSKDIQYLRYVANDLGLKFAHNIGIEKLRERILENM